MQFYSQKREAAQVKISMLYGRVGCFQTNSHYLTTIKRMRDKMAGVTVCYLDYGYLHYTH